MAISKSMSFKGYNFMEWVKRNKDTLKNLLVGVTALATFFATMQNPVWLQIILTVIIPGLVKLGIDAIDFYTTKVAL